MMFNNIKVTETIKQGDIWMCDLGIPDPNDLRNKNIQGYKRPCIIVSNNEGNLHSPIVSLIPLTTRLNKKYPMHKVILKNCGIKEDSYILPEQYQTKNKSVLLFKIGHCDELAWRRVQEGLLIQQGMEKLLNNTSIIKKNIIFDKNRAFKMVASIEQTKKSIKNESRLNIRNILNENLELKIQSLKAYCIDCGEDINNYYCINNNSRIKKYQIC